MHYDNIIKRYILRKNFLRRVKMRLKSFERKLKKNEISDIKQLFVKAGKEPSVIFDCGANIGFVTHKYLKEFPGARIFAFEPNPTVFEGLNKQYKKIQNVCCYNYGIGDVNGELIFNINRNTGTSSFLEANKYHTSNMASKQIRPLKVKVKTLSSIMDENNVHHIDLLKLDIEGYEIKALKGLKDVSKDVSLIFTEVNLIPTYEGQPLIEDIIAYLRSKGFHIYNFYGINENVDFQANITNMLFISDDFRRSLKENGFEKSFMY